MREHSGGTPLTEWSTVDEYFVEALVPQDAALLEARASGAGTTLPKAEVSPGQGAFLALLAQVAGARRVLEFGTLAGYSTIWLARAVGPEGRVVTFELEAGNAAIATRNLERAGVADRVEVVVGPAAASAQRLAEEGAEPFDLVFIDADKPNNPVYLAAALDLTRSGAVIVIDNVVRHGDVVRPQSGNPSVEGVRKVVEDIAANPDLDATALQTVGLKGWDGFILARRR
jgi:predicted O-methyltransferase YrrM